jgi:hypothetical protein
MLRLLTSLLVSGALLASVPALACDEAEKLRLADEISRLAAKNAWSGVERSYQALLETKCELKFESYWLGSESARFLGKTFEQYERLDQAKKIDAQQQVLDSLAAIDGNYGRVDIHGDVRHPPLLTRADMPFAPDQRKSIEWAAQVVTATGSLHGMLPFGDYDVGGVKFTVAAGPDFQQITVGKVKSAPVAKGETPEPGAAPASSGGEKGAINYAGPIVLLGPGFMLTGAPDAVDGANGVEVQPDSVSAAGIVAEIGGEIGLTYSAPEAGLALLVGYGGGFGGAHTFHTVSGWAAGVLRPGQTRIALGPSYQFVAGKGQGIYAPFATGDAENLDVAQLDYSGYSWGAGVRGSVGYGVLDLDKLRGVVDLGGAWHSDGARSYLGFGLQFGIVPAVPRFEQ